MSQSLPTSMAVSDVPLSSLHFSIRPLGGGLPPSSFTANEWVDDDCEGEGEGDDIPVFDAGATPMLRGAVATPLLRASLGPMSLLR